MNQHQKTEAEKVTFSKLNTPYTENIFKSVTFICNVREHFEF